jgi:hypothetical protein
VPDLAANPIDAIAYAFGDVVAEFRSGFGRKEQGGNSSDSETGDEGQDRSWHIASDHGSLLDNLDDCECSFAKERRKPLGGFLPWRLR